MIALPPSCTIPCLLGPVHDYHKYALRLITHNAIFSGFYIGFLHRAALTQASLPLSGSEGASGSGLRSGARAALKRTLQTESDEDDGIDLEDSVTRTAKGKRAANLAELHRTITAPPLGFIDAEGKVHRKHSLFAA